MPISAMQVGAVSIAEVQARPAEREGTRQMATTGDPLRITLGLRAALAGALAVVVTLSADSLGHIPVDVDAAARAGSIYFGAFEVLQGAVVAFGARSTPSVVGRTLVRARGGVGALLGALAVLLAGAGFGFLLLIVTVTALLTGVLEVLVGARRQDAGPASRDAIVAGGLTTLVGVLLLLLPFTVTSTLGLLAAWTALLAVYLGIAAASLRPARQTA